MICFQSHLLVGYLELSRERVSERKENNAKADQPATSTVPQEMRVKQLFSMFRSKHAHVEVPKLIIAR